MRKNGFTFWAFGLSIALHVAAMLALGVVKLHSAENESLTVVPLASVYSPQLAVVNEPVTAKPAVVSPQIQESQSITSVEKKPDFELPVTSTSITTDKITEPALILDTDEKQALPSTAENDESLSQRAIVFFNHSSAVERICVVIDHSGSMKGICSLVMREVESFINGLAPNQYFSLVLFGNGTVSTFDGQKLVQASKSNLIKAIDFASSFSPSGTTNAQDALEVAFRLRDHKGRHAQQIYLVTDGFDLAEDSSRKNVTIVEDLLNKCPKGTKITIVAFWPESHDLELLDAIAVKTGGDVVLIKD